MEVRVLQGEFRQVVQESRWNYAKGNGCVGNTFYEVLQFMPLLPEYTDLHPPSCGTISCSCPGKEIHWMHRFEHCPYFQKEGCLGRLYIFMLCIEGVGLPLTCSLYFETHLTNL